MIDANYLQQFCDARHATLRSPHVFTDPDTKKLYSYATDGHRMMIVNGALEGCNPKDGPNIKQFLMEPQGYVVDCAAFKAFLECDKPTTEKCKDCDGRGRARHRCNCDFCLLDTEECGCEGQMFRILKRGVIKGACINRSLLADMMKDVVDETVLLYVNQPREVIHVFTSDRHLCAMPMLDDGSFKDSPKFSVEAVSHV